MNNFKIINSSKSLLSLIWILENMLKTNVKTENKICSANNVLLTKVDMLIAYYILISLVQNMFN
jgi:hypothetical protein